MCCMRWYLQSTFLPHIYSSLYTSRAHMCDAPGRASKAASVRAIAKEHVMYLHNTYCPARRRRSIAPFSSLFSQLCTPPQERACGGQRVGDGVFCNRSVDT
ncbi:hypothetical protein BDY21DRAFT_333290 [Lineolata rhizophorae]|uniref:Uncharacterized protein n=1 Tax=Lineolata rhizophorae TaxID=578093 RepID=A0A6A6P9X8_9PEZI|nr:hypothetical protein BDY21DRAFT_333290 [Lineolata rhizophorae]